MSSLDCPGSLTELDGDEFLDQLRPDRERLLWAVSTKIPAWRQGIMTTQLIDRRKLIGIRFQRPIQESMWYMRNSWYGGLTQFRSSLQRMHRVKPVILIRTDREGA